jgi:hypothetical protein
MDASNSCILLGETLTHGCASRMPHFFFIMIMPNHPHQLTGPEWTGHGSDDATIQA